MDRPTPPAATVASAAALAMIRPAPLTGFGVWLAEAINHAFGNPREEAAHQPPMVGCQPYTGRHGRS